MEKVLVGVILFVIVVIFTVIGTVGDGEED
jgi:hypothetical protein